MDTHIYDEHVPAMVKYCDRFMLTVGLKDSSILVPIKTSIDDYRLSDFHVMNYHPLKNIDGAVLKMTV
jgi:thymidylate synthase